MKSVIVSGVIGFGILLFLLSGLWTTIFPPESRWTDEKSKRSTEVKTRLYNLAFVVNSPKPNLQRGEDLGQLKAEYKKLSEENEGLIADFNAATETPKTVSKVLKWSGVSIAAIGLIGWYAVNQSN